MVEKVLKSLASLCDLGLFQKMAIWDLVGVVAPLLCHPNLWIRYGAIGFIASTSQRLPVADIWCMIYPIIRPFMRSDVGEVNELHLRENVKPPLSRNVFESSIQWAAVANRTSFWPVRDRPAATRSISVSSSHSLTVPLDLQSGRANEPTPLFVVVKSNEYVGSTARYILKRKFRTQKLTSTLLLLLEMRSTSTNFGRLE